MYFNSFLDFGYGVTFNNKIWICLINFYASQELLINLFVPLYFHEKVGISGF